MPVLTKKQIETRFAVGQPIPINRDNLKFIIQQGLVCDITYRGNLPAPITVRQVRFYNYGTGNGTVFLPTRNYLRFWHLSGSSFTLAPNGSWRTARQDHIISIVWNGNRFRSVVRGYNYGRDAYMNLIEWFTITGQAH